MSDLDNIYQPVVDMPVQPSLARQTTMQSVPAPVVYAPTAQTTTSRDQLDIDFDDLSKLINESTELVKSFAGQPDQDHRITRLCENAIQNREAIVVMYNILTQLRR